MKVPLSRAIRVGQPPVFDTEADGTFMPNDSNTGLVTTTPLGGWQTFTTTQYITTSQRIENVIFACLVKVQCPDVTFYNCQMPGPAAGASGAIVDFSHAASARNVLEHCLVVPQTMTELVNGIQGWGWRARRVRSYHCIDSFEPSPDSNGICNVDIDQCYADKVLRYSPSTTHGDNQTHSDVVGYAGGDGLHIHGCRLESVLDTTVGTGWDATYHSGYPTKAFGTSTIMINSLNNGVETKYQPKNVVIEDNPLLSGGSTIINGRGTGVEFNAAGSSIKRNGFDLTQTQYAVRYAGRTGLQASLVIDSSNYTFNSSDPLNKTSTLTAGQVRVDA